MGGVDEEFICCRGCQALFNRRKRREFLRHKSACSGNPRDSDSKWFACHKDKYLKVYEMPMQEQEKDGKGSASKPKTVQERNLMKENGSRIDDDHDYGVKVSNAKTQSPNQGTPQRPTRTRSGHLKEKDVAGLTTLPLKTENKSAAEVHNTPNTDSTQMEKNPPRKMWLRTIGHGKITKKETKKESVIIKQECSLTETKEKNYAKDAVEEENDEVHEITVRKKTETERKHSKNIVENIATKTRDVTLRKKTDNGEKLSGTIDKKTAKESCDRTKRKNVKLELSPVRVSKRLKEKTPQKSSDDTDDSANPSKKRKASSLSQFMSLLDKGEYEKLDMGKGVTSIKFKCLECDFCTMGMKEYQYHMEWHQKNEDEARLEPDEYSDEEGQSGGARRNYKCRVCSYRTRFYGMFKRHKASHNDGNKFRCEECGEEFLFQRQFTIHLGKHNRHQCEHCGKNYTRRHDLSRHIQNFHTSDSPRDQCLCIICGYKCTYKHLLKDHMRKHTGENFKCELCDFTTIYPRALKQHTSTRHLPATKYQCSDCDYVTNDKGMFGRHIKIHSSERPYRCELCDYRGPDMSYVRAHMTTHSTQKDYCCDQCPYTTNRTNSLRVHMLSKHIGINPWQCEMCAYGALSRQKVRHHILLKHDGKGDAKRRNVVVKFNMKAYKKDSETEDTPKYMVFEQQPETGATECLSWSNLVGDEVSVGNSSPDEEEVYKCAFCEFTNEAVEVVQAHIADVHPCTETEEEQHAEEEKMEDGKVFEEGVTVQDIELVTEPLQGEYHLMPVEGSTTGSVVWVIDGTRGQSTDNTAVDAQTVQVDNVVIEQNMEGDGLTVFYQGAIGRNDNGTAGTLAEDALGVELQSRPDVIEDEAVSTAVESILNLQDAS